MISISLILSGIKTGDTAAAAIDDGGKLIVKLAMFLIPLIMIVAGYVIYRRKYTISEEFYAKMLADLEARGELSPEEMPEAAK